MGRQVQETGLALSKRYLVPDERRHPVDVESTSCNLIKPVVFRHTRCDDLRKLLILCEGEIAAIDGFEYSLFLDFTLTLRVLADLNCQIDQRGDDAKGADELAKGAEVL